MHTLAEIKNLSKTFGDFKAVQDLSFTVYEGDVYGFLGQNGAGKSTSMRMLLTLIQPTSGSIQLFGKELRHNRAEVLRQVGAIIERPDLYKYLNAYDNLEMMARLSGIKPSKKEVLAELDKVGLADRAYDKVKIFSQGMKQRLGIAIALIHNPKLVILDEPTNGLDPQGIAEMRNIIINLRKEHNKTVIVSSHLLNEIEQVATRILIIDKGKKLIEGSAAELFDPAKTHVSLQTPDKAVLEKLKLTAFAPKYQQTIGNELIFEMHRNEIGGFNKLLVEKEVEVISLSPRHSLEDYFLRKTGEPN